MLEVTEHRPPPLTMTHQDSRITRLFVGPRSMNVIFESGEHPSPLFVKVFVSDMPVLCCVVWWLG